MYDESHRPPWRKRRQSRPSLPTSKTQVAPAVCSAPSQPSRCKQPCSQPLPATASILIISRSGTVFLWGSLPRLEPSCRWHAPFRREHLRLTPRLLVHRWGRYLEPFALKRLCLKLALKHGQEPASLADVRLGLVLPTPHDAANRSLIRLILRSNLCDNVLVNILGI